MGIWTRFGSFLWKVGLAVLGFFIGLTCSLLFYEFALKETDFNDAYKVLMFLSTGTFLSLGFAFSSQMACITVLTLPEFVSRSGRRSVQATILILVLAGPLKNLGENGEETLRFFACLKDILWDVFMAGVDLVLAPVQHILLDLKKSASEKENDPNYNASAVQAIMEPIFEEIEGSAEVLKIEAENDRIDLEMGVTGRTLQLEKMFTVAPSASESDRAVKNYQKKLMARCEEIINKGTDSCIKVFKSKYDACASKVGSILAWALCWPMKLEFVCNILSDFSMDKTCKEVNSLVDGSFGDTYAFARKGIDDFTKGFHFSINYQGLSQIISLDSVKEKRDELLLHFLESKKYVEWYLTLIKRCLSLSYLLVLFGALSYHKKYFRRLSFDNVYLSSYFRKIDLQRQQSKRSTLLPLKSFEKCELTPLWRFSLTKAERQRFVNQLFALVVQAGVVFSIFALDHVFKELLDLLRNHGEINIRQEGIHVLAIQIKGEGFLAKLMRQIASDFSVRKDIDIKHFTKPCLPIPKETDPSYYQRILVLFSVLFLNAYFEAHFSRMRHCIADSFFTQRYRRRVIWLYNEMLRRRRRKLAHLKRKALENSEKFKSFMPRNPLQLLAHYFPRRCACLKRWKVGREKCLLCLANGSIYNCPRCGFAYCEECFADVGRRCLHCEAKREQKKKEALMWGQQTGDDVTVSNGQLQKRELNDVV